MREYLAPIDEMFKPGETLVNVKNIQVVDLFYRYSCKS